MNRFFLRRTMITLLILGMGWTGLGWTGAAWGQGGNDEARRHMLRGMAAIEGAKTDADLALAVTEFRKATEIAPDLSAAWFNLGKVQTRLEDFGGAINSYKRYLALAPAAGDAQQVRDEIVKLEFRLERANVVKSRGGTWVAEDGIPFRLMLDGNRMTLVTGTYRVSNAEAESNYPLAGKIPINHLVPLKYDLAIEGNRVSGSWRRGAVKADACTIPEDGGEVTGEIRDAEHLLTLRYAYTSYQAYTGMSLLSDDYCRKVEASDKKEIEKKFFGPLPQGGIGVLLGGIYSYWAGGFSAVKFGWSGHLVVADVKADSPAYGAGLRKEDEILAIDKVEVKTLSGSEAIRRLRGEPGTEVELSIMRKKKADAPLTMRLRRVAIPDDGKSMLN